MKNSNLVISALIASALASATTAHAAGFALMEQSGSSVGNAFAGAAASAEDASTIFFNPAGMTYLPDNQLVVALHAIKPSAEFTNNGSRSGAGTLMTGGNGGDAGNWAALPNIYFTKALTDKAHIGISINAPFGLKTEYNGNWVGRYQALKSELRTLNINPSFALKLNETLSVGAGLNLQRAEATLTNAVDFGTICAGTALAGLCGAPQQRDGYARVYGDDWSVGYNLGAIFQVGQSTRLGLAYRSEVKHELQGDVTFGNVPSAFGLSGALTALFANGGITANATMPAIASASIFHQVNDQWDVMADLTWTEWNSFEELRIIRSSGALTGSTLSVQKENWENTLRASVGASYRYSDSLKLRAGYAFDESPVPDAFRTPRIPDNDRQWISLGANYKFSPSSSLDAGYTHIFVKNSSLSQGTVPSSAGKLVGSYDSDVNILSVQFTHTF